MDNNDVNKEILEKLSELESKLSVLEARSEQLAGELEHIKKSSGSAVNQQTLQGQPMHRQQTSQNQRAANRQQAMQRQQALRAQQLAAKQQKKVERRSNLEGFIGKNAMGIGATLLVLIAMVMFATILMPYIGEELKCAAMYVFSLILIGLGEYVYRRQKNGYLILSLCGMAAIFVSLFATDIYFHFIDSLPLYALLLLWMGATAYLGKKRHMLYVILGQIGIFTALIIASIGIITAGDLYLSAGFLALSEALFFTLFWKSGYRYDLINTIGLFASLVVFVMGAHYKVLSLRYADSPIGIALIIASIVLMAAAACRLIVRSGDDKEYTASGIISMVNAGSAMLTAYFFKSAMEKRGYMNTSTYATLLKDSSWCYLLLTLYLAAVLIALIKMQHKNSEKRPMLQYICLSAAVISLTLLPDKAVPYMILAVLAALVIYNYKANRKDLYYVSQTVTLFSIYEMLDNESLPAAILILAISLTQMIYSRIKNPDTRMLRYEGISYISTIFLMILIVDQFAYRIWPGSAFMNYFVIVGLFIVIQMAARETDWTDSDADKIGIFHIANLGMMVYSLGGFVEDLSIVELIFYTLLTGGLFSINLAQLLEIKERFGAYIAAKYTLLLTMVLVCLEAEGYVYSIAFLLLAIASIIVGFKLNNRSIRLFGLVLSMFSVFKLIMIDMSYSNTLGRAFSFLISGLICFGISLIYNRIDKQQKMKSVERTDGTGREDTTSQE